LVELNRRYNRAFMGIPRRTELGVAFMKSATWPHWIDAVRSHQTTATRRRLQEPQVRASGNKDKLVHKSWYFVDQPYPTPKTANRQPQLSVNALAEIGILKAALSISDPPETKAGESGTIDPATTTSSRYS
jgi:hypothetical protein